MISFLKYTVIVSNQQIYEYIDIVAWYKIIILLQFTVKVRYITFCYIRFYVSLDIYLLWIDYEIPEIQHSQQTEKWVYVHSNFGTDKRNKVDIH